MENQHSRYGHIGMKVEANPNAKFFFVGDATDAYFGDFMGQFPPDKDGVVRVFSTIDAAINVCVANRGDKIYVMPAYAETISAAAGIAADIAGVEIIGMGNGEDRPTITFATSTAASIAVTAASISFKNFIFKCNIASQNHMFDVVGDALLIENCDFREGTATGLSFIAADTADNDSDRLTVRGCKFYAPTAGNMDFAINIAKDFVGVRIEDCEIYGDFDEAGINVAAGGNAQVDMVIKNCDITNLLTGQHGIQINGTASTGKIINVNVVTDSLATSVDAGGLEMFNVLHNVGVDQGGWTSIGASSDVDESAIGGSGVNPFGTAYYVSTSGSASNSGLSPSSPLDTIAAAIALGSAGDSIILSPGTHSVDVSAAALIPKANMQFIAAIDPMGGKPTTIITHDADDGADLVALDVSGVKFKGIEFLMVAGGTTAVNLFNISQTTAVTGVSFEDCWFNLNDVDGAAVTALNIDDATNATTGMVLKNCRFLGGSATTNVATYVDVGVGGIPKALIEDNVFELSSVDGDCTAFTFADPGAAGKSYAFVARNNDFIGSSDAGNDAVAFVFNAAMTEDEIAAMIRTNYFAHCSATPVTIDKVNSGVVNNWVGNDADGGILVDPGT